MPHPLLVVNPVLMEPQAEEKEQPLKVGTLLVQPWGTAKTVHNKVCKIVKVTSRKVGRGKWSTSYYYYDVQWLGANVEKEVDSDRYITFKEYKERLDNNIVKQNKILNRQYQKRADADVLEQKAKQAFGV